MKGELKKLRIESYTSSKYDKEPAKTFTVMFNPTSYSVKLAVEYDKEQGKGTAGIPQKYKKSNPTQFSLEFVLDGTGTDGEKQDVSELVSEFQETVYKFDGDIHRPRYLKIAWGTLLITCVFKGADIKYTLFKPSGEALRASITANFVGYVEDAKRAAQQNEKSPDLFRVHTVQEGDTLPGLATQYYGQPIHYLQLAKYNELNNFRELQEGQRLVFPPLAKKAKG